MKIFDLLYAGAYMSSLDFLMGSTLARTHSTYQLTKISSLEIDIIDLKMTVKSGLEFLTLVSHFIIANSQCKIICPERLSWPGR